MEWRDYRLKEKRKKDETMGKGRATRKRKMERRKRWGWEGEKGKEGRKGLTLNLWTNPYRLRISYPRYLSTWPFEASLRANTSKDQLSTPCHNTWITHFNHLYYFSDGKSIRRKIKLKENQTAEKSESEKYLLLWVSPRCEQVFEWGSLHTIDDKSCKMCMYCYYCFKTSKKCFTCLQFKIETRLYKKG